MGEPTLDGAPGREDATSSPGNPSASKDASTSSDVNTRPKDGSSSAPCEADQIASFDFDEGTGATTCDRCNPSRCTVAGALTWTTGVRGGAVDFKGTTCLALSGDVSEITLEGKPFTVAAWISQRIGGADAHQYMFSRFPSSSLLGWGMRTHFVTDQLRAMLHYNSSFINGVIDLPPPAWVHLAVTYDQGSARVYLDGVEERVQGATSFSPSAEAEPRIGCASGNRYRFDGVMDELRIYRAALPASRIQSLAVR